MKISFPFPRHSKHAAPIMIVGLAILVFGGSPACIMRKQSKPTEARRYDLKGKVVSFDKAKKEVTIAHEEIKGYMPAMTMPFPLHDEWAFDHLAPGSNVGATLVVDSNSFWLQDIVISSGGDDPINTGPTERRPNAVVGHEMIKFDLVNQDGKGISLEKYKGKALLLTFIYTRCPLPEYCTLMSTNFAELNKQFAANQSLHDRTHLLSITIDPAYDTPKVLRSYGASHTGKYTEETFASWEFATGKPAEIKRIAEFFGLTYFEEREQITHSLRTALISPDGKVVKVYDGNDWKPADALVDVEKLLGGT